MGNAPFKNHRRGISGRRFAAGKGFDLIWLRNSCQAGLQECGKSGIILLKSIRQEGS